MIKEELLKRIRNVVENEEIELSHPVNSDHGDYATSIALKLAKKQKKNPMDLAKDIASKIPADDLIEKVEVAPPGFINIHLKASALINEMKKIIDQKDAYGKSSKSNKTVLLEFGQPNTHKVPHIGHLYSYIFGESIARILEWNGNKVIRVNYQGDIGLHVAKCLYVLKKRLGTMKDLQVLKDKVMFLQACYQEGSSEYEKNEETKKEIDTLNNQIYKKSGEIHELWEETRNWSIEFYKDFEKQLGIKYDKYYFESEISDEGKHIIESNIGDVFEKSEGAIIFRGEKYKINTRVFINKFGNPTYEAKDIGLISRKLKDYDFDLSLVTTASEQNDYWRVIKKVSELLFPKLEGKIKHIGFGMINLVTGKMSSRTGNVINAFSLVEKVQSEVEQEYKLDPDIALAIALASIKYSFLLSDAYKNMSFDLKQSIAREGDSGPYLLYSYARCRSILKNVEFTNEYKFQNFNTEEKNILRQLYQFEEVIQRAGDDYFPHLIRGYIFELAQKFNVFYQKHSVLKAGSDEKNFRLGLTTAVAHVIKNGLNLLGIETVEKM